MQSLYEELAHTFIEAGKCKICSSDIAAKYKGLKAAIELGELMS